MAQKNLSTENKQTITTKLIDTENRLVVAKGEGSGLDGEFGVGTWKLLHLEWIGNEILLCSTGNCIQSLVIEHDRREYEKKNIYICMTESLCCTTEIDRIL